LFALFFYHATLAVAATGGGGGGGVGGGGLFCYSRTPNPNERMDGRTNERMNELTIELNTR